MRGLQRFGNLLPDTQRLVYRNCSALDPLGQRLSLDQFHHEKVLAVGLFQAVDRRNVRMVQRGEDARFPLQSRNTFGIARERLRQEFDGDAGRIEDAAASAHRA